MDIVVHPRKIDVYQLTRNEINDLQEAGNYKTLDVAMASICITIFVSFLIVLLTVSTESNRQFIAFLTITIAGGIGTVFFGFRAIIAWRRAALQARELLKTDRE